MCPPLPWVCPWQLQSLRQDAWPRPIFRRGWSRSSPP
jgi:hypothetical protein